LCYEVRVRGEEEIIMYENGVPWSLWIFF